MIKNAENKFEWKNSWTLAFSDESEVVLTLETHAYSLAFTLRFSAPDWHNLILYDL